MTENPYDHWLAKCRETTPPTTLADRIMSQVVTMDAQCRSLWWVRVLQQIERSRASRWALCAAALAVGCLPFVFLLHVAQLVSF